MRHHWRMQRSGRKCQWRRRRALQPEPRHDGPVTGTGVQKSGTGGKNLGCSTSPTEADCGRTVPFLLGNTTSSFEAVVCAGSRSTHFSQHNSHCSCAHRRRKYSPFARALALVIFSALYFTATTTTWPLTTSPSCSRSSRSRSPRRYGSGAVFYQLLCMHSFVCSVPLSACARFVLSRDTCSF